MSKDNKIVSMTGFATAETQSDTHQFLWELKSVNSKTLDIRLRLPNGFEQLEPKLKAAVAERTNRGTVYANLTASRSSAVSRLMVDENALTATHAALKLIAEKTGAALPDAAAILQIKGVAVWDDTKQDDASLLEANETLILDGLNSALDQFSKVRTEEGERLGAALSAQLSTMNNMVDAIAADPSHGADAIRQRIKRQIATLMQADNSLDEDRLHQEIALLATKADLQEEIDRLNAHLAAARDLLATGGLIGRRLDFLAQEFNREANTICSKSNAASISTLGVDLKVTIDQLREQVQNIE